MPRFLFFIFAKFRNDVQSKSIGHISIFALLTLSEAPGPLPPCFLLSSPSSFVMMLSAVLLLALCLLTSQPHLWAPTSFQTHPPLPRNSTPPVNAAVSQEIHIQTSSFFIATHSSYVSWSILSCNYLSTRKPLPLSSVQNSGYKCLLPWISRNLEQILKSKPIYLYLLPPIKTCSSSSQSVVSISHQSS